MKKLKGIMIKPDFNRETIAMVMATVFAGLAARDGGDAEVNGVAEISKLVEIASDATGHLLDASLEMESVYIEMAEEKASGI